MPSVTGRVTSIRFNSDSFYVLDLLVWKSDPVGAPKNVTVRGNFYGLTQLQFDVPITVFGQWRKHPKYGRQLNVRSWEPWSRNDTGRIRFLNVCVPGFESPRLTEAVVQKYGSDTFTALTERPLEVASSVDVDGIDQAVTGWAMVLATRDLTTLLQEGGLGATEVGWAMARFGAKAGTVIKDNPYCLMEVQGFTFPKVDAVADHLGFSKNDPKRLEGAVLWALRAIAQEGHLYLRRGDISKYVASLMARYKLVAPPSGSSDDYNHAVERLEARKALKVDSGVGVYLMEFYDYERAAARMLGELMKPSAIEVDLKPFLEGYERSNRIKLSDSQREAVSCLIDHRVLVLTGLPGTGKTTAIRALVRLFEEARVSFALMAPTGIAAKRLAAVTEHNAGTVHRTLRYDGVHWGYDEFNRFLVDAVIVDEVSMMDQELFYRLLSALRPDTMLVLVGDDAQLPSVGPGNVLKELVSCSQVPHVRLTQIFRQDEKGDIVSNSHRINRGEMLDLPDPKSPSEFKLLRLSDEDKIADYVVRLATKLKKKDANFQVLSPKYAGPVGVDALNAKLRDALNPPGPPEWQNRTLNFRLGDRLMVVKNDYELDVYNGDMGKLIQIHKDFLRVRIHAPGADTQVDFPIEQVSEKLRLAYCVTVHKSQGSEFDTIVMPVVRSQGRMLQRNLLYTAVTRARKHVWLIGEETAVQRAIDNNKVVQRNTILGRAVSGVLDRVGAPEGPDRTAEEAPPASPG